MVGACVHLKNRIDTHSAVCVCGCSKSDWCGVRATVENDGGVDGICATLCAVMCCVCDSE
jgi:hypothetical protein